MFLKDKLYDQGDIYQGSASDIIFMAHNWQSLGIPFLMTALSKNAEATFSGHMSMFQNYLQLDTMKLESFQLQMGFSFPFLRANNLRLSLLIMRTCSFLLSCK